MDNLNNLPLLNIPLHIDRAFEDLCYEEKVLECSETILKFISTALSKSEQNEVALPKDVEDILKRLLNGLTSKDGFLKHGCYTTLQVLLQLHPEILPFTLACMEETFTKTKMVNKNDQTFGHVLALGALIRSGCVLNNPVLLKNVILKLGNAKTLSLSPIAGQFLVNLAMQKDGIIIKSLWKYLQGSLLHSFDSLTPCLMWLRFVLCRREYRKYLQNVPSNFYDEMIDVPSFTVIALTFKELFCNNVNVTPMIDDYFKSLILFCNDEHKGVDNLALFFSKAIMPLMQSPSFRNIIFIFSITQMALPHLTTGDHVGKVLSKELCELLIFSKKLRADQVESSARGLMEAILQHLIKNKKNLNSEIQLKTLKQLLSTSASLKFDAVMETSLLHQATDHLNPTAVIKLAECLIEKVKEYQESSLPPKSTIVQLIGNWLSRLVCLSNLRSSEHTELRASLLWMILELTFMKFPDQTVSALKKVFLRSLIQPTNNLEDLNRVIEIILEKANTMPYEGLPGKKTKVSFDNVSACLLQLKENKKIPKNQAPIFKVVCGHFMLHLIMNDGSMHFIDELMKCFEIGLQPRRKSAYEFHSDFYEDNSSTDWVEVTVELLLRILSKEESFWRKIVTNIFKNICHSLKPYSLYLLTDVIDPEKEADVLCSESEDEDMENLNSDDDSDIVENDRDEGSSSENDEMDACEGQKELKDDENEDLSNIVGDDEVADGENDDTENGSLIKIKMEMQKLVGDSESGVDVELDSVPQEELDNLDRRLGALVGQFISLRKKKHQIKKKLLSDETALMHFRIRVCQLLEVVIEEAPTLDHLVALIQPLLKALNRFSRDDLQKPLSQRLKTVIVGLSKVKKYDKPATLKAGDLVQELNFLSNLRENSSSRINEEIELCYTFLIRSGLHLPSKEENPSPADTLFITYAKHLEAITIKSSSNLIERPLQLDTPSIGIVLSKVLSLAFRSSLKPSRRKVLLDLIKLAFQNEKAIAKVPKNILSACFSDLNTNVIKTFNAILRPNQIQSKYLVALVELLKFLKNLHRGNRDLEMGFQWAEVVCVLSSFVKRIPLTDYKPLKKAIKAAEQSLQTPNCTGLQKEKKNGSKKMKIGFPKTETKPRMETVTKATSKIATEINDDEFSVKESDYDEFFIEDDDSCDSDDLDEKKFMLKMRNLEKDYETKRREVPFEKISKRHANKFGDPGPVSLNNNFKALIEARKEEKILKRQRKERNIEKKARKIKKKEKQSASKKVYVSTKKPKKSRKLLKIKREENKAARMEKRQMEKLGSLSFSVLNSL